MDKTQPDKQTFGGKCMAFARLVFWIVIIGLFQVGFTIRSWQIDIKPLLATISRFLPGAILLPVAWFCLLFLPAIIAGVLYVLVIKRSVLFAKNHWACALGPASILAFLLWWLSMSICANTYGT